MLSLTTSTNVVKVGLEGVIRYLSTPQISDKWVPLSGDYLPALENPVVFGIYGFKYGQQIFDGNLYFALPTMNSTSAGVPSIYPRPLNTKNSNGRNLGRAVGDLVNGTIKAHNHTGTTSPAGAHNHAVMRASGLSFPVGPWPTAIANGLYPCSYQMQTIAIGHGEHFHADASSGAMVLDSNYVGAEVEPKAFGAILCIHRG